MKQLARKSALSYKAQDNNIVVLNELELATPKTKSFVEILNNLQLADKKTLFVLSNGNKNVYLSARNLTRTKVVTVSELNTYLIMNFSNVVFTENSIEVLEQNFKA